MNGNESNQGSSLCDKAGGDSMDKLAFQKAMNEARQLVVESNVE